MKIRTRKHYARNTWVGQLFTLENDIKAYRLFVFWEEANSYMPMPFEFQIVDWSNPNLLVRTKTFPKRRRK